ncbi:septum formation family protein, partial [Streptomyces bohaiensis]|uniref:septum formation family protein n=1 Tax=Streptomyces bohaiensis TaxID=1431344 RepID=UPI0030C75A22
HNPWAAPSPAAAHPNPWAAPAPAAVPAAFGAPPQPGEQLPREPLSIAAIGAAGMLLSPVALGLSALALRRHRRRPARGRSLAVAAATIAVAQLGVAAVAVPVALSWDSGEETAVAAERTTEVEPADDTPDDGKAPSKDDPEWQDWHDEVDPDLPTATGPLWADVLAPGDCIGALPEGDAVLDLGLVSCEAPHEGEVFGRVELFGQGEEAPDDEELMDLAYQGCDPQIVPYLLDSWKVLAEDEPLEVAVMHPTAETWAHGDRQVTCYFVGPGGEPTTGSARGNPAAYDVDQRTLLRITGPRDSAMLSSPYLHDHERLTAWAETTGEAAENQAALLRNIYLDQYGATPAALGLARAREAEAEFWREVADAPDTDAFYAAMAEDETIEAAETAEAKLREKLDLPTS